MTFHVMLLNHIFITNSTNVFEIGILMLPLLGEIFLIVHRLYYEQIHPFNPNSIIVLPQNIRSLAHNYS